MSSLYGCIGEVRNLGELNHLLLCVRRELQREGKASYLLCCQTFESVTFCGTFCTMDEAIKLASLFDLVELRPEDQSLGMKSNGRAFLKLNPSDNYEITETQRRFLIEFLLRSMSPMGRDFEQVIEDFFYNKETKRYEAKDSIDLTTEKRSLIVLCYLLGLLQQDSSKVFFDDAYNDAVARKIRIIRNPDWWDKEPSEEDIEQSRYAEVMVANLEMERLRGLGRPDLAEGVDLICDRDSGYGCDIISFEGIDSKISLPDRYIEVKSSKGHKLLFFISRTEMKKARQFRSHYSVIFIGGMAVGKSIAECTVEEIRDPAVSLFNVSKYMLESKKIAVSKIESA